MKDFVKAIGNQKGTVSKEQCEKYERWNDEFGQKLYDQSSDDDDIDMNKNNNHNFA